jgi:hypothetical protein
MDDREIEALLRRYRPVERAPRAPRVWPWAAAAAALLAIVVGLHAGAIVAAPDERIDARSSQDGVSTLAAQFGGDARARRLADWMVAREQPDEESIRENPSD